MNSIKQIEDGSIHKIQSGQVIVDLCSVVKELVENSLDAKSTSIEIRFKNSGLEAIEVQDNGLGIAPQDYESTALKHYTSKLREYGDLLSLQTFGFRGEALSSLCAMSDVHVITAREVDAPKGARLDFEHSGRLRGTQVVAAQRGTTVVVETIFKNLPVRRQELERNIKREYAKALNLLQAYACISTEVRISVTNVTGNGRRSVMFATNSNLSTKDNIANVFGAKTLMALVPLNLQFEMLAGSSLGGKDKQVQVVGHISRPMYGHGRSTPDRQMYFVNSRPCVLPQIVKLVNEVYKIFNLSQSPFVFANVLLDTNSYDVNVSPDKRTILLHDQATLLDNLRTSLTSLFEGEQQTVPQMNTQQSVPRSMQLRRSQTRLQEYASSPIEVEQRAFSDATVQHKRTGSSADREFASSTLDNRETQRGAGSSDEGVGKNRIHLQHLSVHGMRDLRNVSSEAASTSNSTDFMPREVPSGPSNSIANDNAIMDGHSDSIEEGTVSIHHPQASNGNHSTSTTISQCPSKKSGTSSITRKHTTRRVQAASTQTFGKSLRQFSAWQSSPSETQDDDGGFDPSAEMDSNDPDVASYKETSLSQDDSDAEIVDRSMPLSTEIQVSSIEIEIESESESEKSDDEYLDDEAKKAKEDARVARIIERAEARAAAPSLDDVQRAQRLLKGGQERKVHTMALEIFESTDSILHKCRALRESMTKYREGILAETNTPENNNDPEAQLFLDVSKADFARMRIVGQFNLGFVISARPPKTGDDAHQLFIIDQHASDEIYNFERLQATTVVHNQRLVKPMILDLTAIEEEVVLENRDTLVKNGFLIEANTSGLSPIRHRCTLVTLPMSREVTFSVQDLEELISLLGESSIITGDKPDSGNKLPNSVIRPSKVRKMFAMRACRSSVMVGKTLNTVQMEKLVRHMGEIDKPWNCPHGRPTMRHLFKLNNWAAWNETDGVTGIGDFGTPNRPDWKQYQSTR